MPFLLRCFLVLLLATPLHAQSAYRCDRSGGSVITGTIRDTHTHAPISNMFVSIYRNPDVYCRMNTDASGRFVFSGVPAGTFIFIARKPLNVTTTGSDTVRLDVDVVTGGPLEVCQKTASCANWVKPMKVRFLSESEQFEFTLLRLAAVLARENPNEASTWFCVPQSSRLVLEAMQRMYFRSAPSSGCDLVGDVDPRDTGAYLVHKPTGQRALQLNTGQKYGHTHSPGPRLVPPSGNPRLDAQVREVQLGYYVGPMAAEGWTCALRNTAKGWIPIICRRDWIS